MLIRILLDEKLSHFTNLDVISGKVLLHLLKKSHVTSIIVKLEGESKTRLLSANDMQRPLMEDHKFLYKIQEVFPNKNSQNHAPSQQSFASDVGQHVYPFRFKVPFNNMCLITQNSSIRHVKQTLPPSLAGFSNEVEIFYYLKATVNRAGIFKENPRARETIIFLPIEPPRPEVVDGETYARCHHQFNSVLGTSETKNTQRGIFNRKLKEKLTDSPMPNYLAGPRFVVDVRLPVPSILTCNRELPLRIIVKQLDDHLDPLYLQLLQIELIGYTKLRAQGITQTKTNQWVVVSVGNTQMQIGSPRNAVGTETEIDSKYWLTKPLSSTIAPTFTTCIVSRVYELGIRVGLNYGTFARNQGRAPVILPFRIPVKVYSGVTPPQALLEATSIGVGSVAPLTEEQFLPNSPTDTRSGSTVEPAQSPRNHCLPQQEAFPCPDYHLSAQTALGYEEAPPSYEDAIAENLPPLMAQRQYYVPISPSNDVSGFSRDNRRDQNSDR